MTQATQTARGKHGNHGARTGTDLGGRAHRPRTTARSGRHRPRTPGPRSRRHHTRGDAGRPAHGADQRRRGRGRPPSPRRRRRGAAPRRLPGQTGPRGLRVVQPHLRQRHPCPVAVTAALHGRQPRALDAPRRPRPPRRGPAVRSARPADRAHPDRAAGRRRLRGRPRPGRLAVRGHARVRRGTLLAGLPLPGPVPRRLVEPARPPPRPGLPGAHGPDLPAVVPVPPHLERVRVPAAGVPRGRTRGGDRPHRTRPPRLLVRAPPGGPAACRAHRRGSADGRRGGRRPRGPLRQRGRRARPARIPGPVAVHGPRRRRVRRAVGGLPPRPQRAPARPGNGRDTGAGAARGRDRPARPHPAVRRLVTARLAVDGPAAR